MIRLIVLIIIAGCMTGCGVPGPLYLPDKSQAVSTTPADTTAAQSSESSSSSSSTSESKN